MTDAKTAAKSGQTQIPLSSVRHCILPFFTLASLCASVALLDRLRTALHQHVLLSSFYVAR
jgi:hypothetical protein